MEMRAAAGPLAAAESGMSTPAKPTAAVDAAPWLTALGGRQNVAEAGSASSRLWLRLQDAGKLDEAALGKLGVRMVARPSPGTIQLLVENAEPIAAALQPG
jgi:PTS system N-acetylglucosamine-specific IIC component